MKKGDHLVSPRIGYDHHGLYIGGGEVIHYSGFSEAFDKGSIEITSLEEFEQGNGSKVKNHIVSVYDADKRVERAFSKLGEDSYSLIFNNCEHFVNWCFNGFKTSSQVNNVTATAVLANEYLKRKGAQTAASVLTQQVTRATATKTAQTALASAVVKSTVSTAASSAAGFTAASAVTGTTAAGVVSALAAGSVVSVAAPVAVAVGVGYGVKKVFDWLFD